jgi:hypothetical protein
LRRIADDDDDDLITGSKKVNDDSDCDVDLVESTPPPPPQPPAPPASKRQPRAPRPEKNLRSEKFADVPRENIQWKCGACTFDNKLSNNECEMCAADFSKFTEYVVCMDAPVTKASKGKMFNSFSLY